MKKNFNSKKLAFQDYNYISYNNSFKYCNYSIKTIQSKNNNFSNELIHLSKNDLILENNEEKDFPTKKINIENFKSFYPKNYKNEEIKLSYIYNDNISNENNNVNIISIENSKSYHNKKNENENQSLNEEKSKQIEKESIFPEYKKDKKFNSEKTKKFFIKSIPHPKKNQETYYIPRKKLFNFQHKIEVEKYLLSLISNQNNNYDSSKNSASTLNTSSSSYKEKFKSNDENKNYFLNDNQNFEFNYSNMNKNNIKNKFERVIIKNINNNLENTEILKVNIKISNNKIIIFKLRRFDDLFLTIKIFCEINSIDEKLIKPLIIKLLCTLNTIYQIINSDLSYEAIGLLKQIKNINEQK